MPRTVETTVTYLEMTQRKHVAVHPPVNIKLALMEAVKPPVHFYRYLYDTIGRDHVWHDRRRLSITELEEQIHAEGIEIFVAYVTGCPAGYYELDSRKSEEVWLAYFGIVPEFLGLGLGKWLLSEAIAAAWEKGPERIRVETCTLDHPRALPLYQKLGFEPYAQKHKQMELLD
ncbi:GNAT superfamily N-acetyltransferase [Rhodoligotrophos appendicifer]|uniref:GNAT family N-acetyltransferase n=1 Tax=Rhodoligotrophos appendicifer TaxID=987056 RepID=UPI001186B66C|nr:GNAT family N-acetyltransferase [Rhodoligotrophos appendicifer]